MHDLAKTLDEIRGRIQLAAKRRLNEYNTKATLIEPVLRALGWNIENVEEVEREFKLETRDKPVDYGLMILREPCLLVEAKALGENLDDRRWANQIMGYASVAGVEWIILTDGDEYRIYNSHAPLTVDEKLFRTVRVSEGGPFLVSTLELLGRHRMQDRLIDVLWHTEHVDRQVAAAVEELFTEDGFPLIVNLIERRTKHITADDIRAAIRRCHVELEFPDPAEAEPPPTRSEQSTPEPGPAPKQVFAGTLSELIEAGVLHAPATLEKSYKGRLLTARVEMDGRVSVGGEIYDSPSTAAGAARATVIGLTADGRFPPTNGWTFWKLRQADGTGVELAALRSMIREKRDRGAVG